MPIEEARSLGLVVNEQKTVSPKFVTYAMDTLGLVNVDDDVAAWVPLARTDERATVSPQRTVSLVLWMPR